MAKDGTNRGGRRVRAGDKPKPLAEKIAAGEDADIIEFTPTVLEGADLDDAADLVGEEMPSPSEYLSARQKDGKPLGADAGDVCHIYYADSACYFCGSELICHYRRRSGIKQKEHSHEHFSC
jgi:hypothetical protein